MIYQKKKKKKITKQCKITRQTIKEREADFVEADKRSLGSTGLEQLPLIFDSVAAWGRHHLIYKNKPKQSFF
jgi:hypothetical protein